MQNADPCRPAFVLVEHRGFEPLTFSLRKPPCRGLAPLGGGFPPADGCSGAVDSNSGARAKAGVRFSIRRGPCR